MWFLCSGIFNVVILLLCKLARTKKVSTIGYNCAHWHTLPASLAEGEQARGTTAADLPPNLKGKVTPPLHGRHLVAQPQRMRYWSLRKCGMQVSPRDPHRHEKFPLSPLMRKGREDVRAGLLWRERFRARRARPWPPRPASPLLPPVPSLLPQPLPSQQSRAAKRKRRIHVRCLGNRY